MATKVTIRGTGESSDYSLVFDGSITNTESLEFDDLVVKERGEVVGTIIDGEDVYFGEGDVTIQNIDGGTIIGDAPDIIVEVGGITRTITAGEIVDFIVSGDGDGGTDGGDGNGTNGGDGNGGGGFEGEPNIQDPSFTASISESGDVTVSYTVENTGGGEDFVEVDIDLDIGNNGQIDSSITKGHWISADSSVSNSVTFSQSVPDQAGARVCVGISGREPECEIVRKGKDGGVNMRNLAIGGAIALAGIFAVSRGNNGN